MFPPKNALKILESIANNEYVGMTILDKNGAIIFRNKVAEEISGIRNEDVLGKHFSTIPGKGELLEVLHTGRPKLGLSYTTKAGKKAIVHRFPLHSANEIIGAMTVITFKDVLEMEKILRKYNLLKGKLEYYEEELQRFRLAKYSLASIVTNDKKMLYAKDLAKRYAKRKAPVLITGETGTGKELFAHAIHLASPSKNGPFIRVNCASIPHELLESELFGYESGAFTGAKKDGKPGKFELANHGTIFLDEIGSMDLGMQAKILRVLQDKELERLGSNKVTKVDFRVISATNKNLESLVKDEKFRLDLYYRLVVLSLDIPPLRERKNDIQLLCSYLIRTFNDEIGTKISMIDEETMGILLNWDWPGNVRELRNVIERAVNLAENGIISVTHLPSYLARPSEHNNESIRKTRGINIIKEAKTTVERQMLDSTLSDTNWNISQSARDLGISRQLLYSLIRKYGLRKPGAR